MTQEITEEEINALKSFNSPWSLIKKALSSIGIMAVMASGIIVNAVLGLIYVFGWFSGSSWMGYIFGILLLLVFFPVAYFFAAYWYGQSVLIWETYQEVVRPLTAKVFASSLDKILKEEEESDKEKTDSEIVAELENRSKYWVEILPDFIRAYFQVFITGKDVVDIIKKQRERGVEKEAVKRKAMKSMYDSLDLQMQELIGSSTWIFWLVAIINIVVVYFWMFYSDGV